MNFRLKNFAKRFYQAMEFRTVTNIVTAIRELDERTTALLGP